MSGYFDLRSPKQVRNRSIQLPVDETIVLDLYIHTIFPIPKCYAKYNDGKQSENSGMNMTKNGIFYKIHFQSNISLENKKCDGKVEISCMTGSTDIPMYSASVNYCQRLTSSDVVVANHLACMNSSNAENLPRAAKVSMFDIVNIDYVNCYD
ncbi:unnamed protein product [Mytilus edulis]|uniref:Uncharacterized protein n=1 Tax=Mytilus edulis TaxID=6550 RepID=A0A8S3PSA5_MYTED|nr:unnamed protein product [Mytilus edulis]